MAKKETAAKAAPQPAASQAAPQVQEVTAEQTGVSYDQLYKKALQLDAQLKSANAKLAVIQNALAI